MKLSLIIVLVLKLVNCAISYSENANVKNVGTNFVTFREGDTNETLELHKTKYEDKQNYFCFVCLNKALCKEKGKCYMCMKHCKNFRKLQEYEKFQVATEPNFHPNEKIKFNISNTSGKEFTIYSKIKNDVFTKLYNYIKSALTNVSTIPKQTSTRANLKSEKLQTWNNSSQSDEEIAINNNLIHLKNKNNENDVDIPSLPYNSRKKRNSNTINEIQAKVKTACNRHKIHLLEKRDLHESDINNTQITNEKFNNARPFGGLLRKINVSGPGKNRPLLSMLSMNQTEENNAGFLKPIQNQPLIPTQTFTSTGGNIVPVNKSLKQIPLLTNRNQIPQLDVNQNGRIFKPEGNGIDSQPFTENGGADAILTSPLLFPTNEIKPCNENLGGDISRTDGKTFSILQNLEKKIENIADLIKQGCKYNDILKSENPENPNRLLNKNKIKMPGLPNDIFGKTRNNINKDKANFFPNRIMQIPDSQSQTEDGDENESQTPVSVNNDKILRDINPALFSENDDNSDNLNNNDDELENNGEKSDTKQSDKLESTPISFRNQFRLRKNPLQNDRNKPLLPELFNKRGESKPNLNNRFTNLDKNEEQIPEENLYEPVERYEEKPEEAYEPGVPWINNKERSKPNLLPKPKPNFPKMKGIMPRNNIKDRFKNNALPLQPRENIKPALSHLNNFISKLNDATFPKIPKANPPWNRIANPDIQKLHFPLNKLDAEKPGRIPFQRVNPKSQESIADEQPKTKPFLLPKDRPRKHPNLPLIHQRFAEPDNVDPSVPVGSSVNNYEENPNTLLGHVVIPQHSSNEGLQSFDDIENKKIFFEGTGVNLPLTIKKNPEGTYKVSLAVDNICSTCNGKSCNIKEDLVGAPLNQENTKSTLKNKDLNDNVQNLSLPKNELETDHIPQGETNNKLPNVRGSNSANEDIPEIKPRLFDKENNFFNRRRNNDGVDVRSKPIPLFPRLSQVAKRSPSLLFNSPILTLGGNYLDNEYSKDFKTLDEYRGKNLKSKLNNLKSFEGKNEEKVNKKVALMKDMLTWMKNVAEENTALA